jgi:hypothetical protein
MSELNNYVNALSLSTNDEAFRGLGLTYLDKRKNALENDETDEDESFLNFKSLDSFVAGVSPQKQEDVLNSLLLAQRVAQKAFPAENQILLWYEKYFEVLTRIGWVFENRGFTNYNAAGRRFEMNSAIIEILTAAIASATGVGAAAALVILNKTLAAVQNLADDDARIVAFEKNVKTTTKANFQLGIATEKNGAISIISSAFILETSEKSKKILFFKTNKDDFAFKFNIIKATINDAVYSEARNTIKTKLVGDINQYITDLDI